MVSPHSYREQSRKYLTQAYLELEQGDLCQASEKGWGAAAEMIKAVAKERGWYHTAHWHLRRAVDLLTEELDDTDIVDCFAFAGELHTNFYEGWLSSVVIGRRLTQVAKFVDKVEAVLPP